jgi:hypothetical protein
MGGFASRAAMLVSSFWYLAQNAAYLVETRLPARLTTLAPHLCRYPDVAWPYTPSTFVTSGNSCFFESQQMMSHSTAAVAAS